MTDLNPHRGYTPVSRAHSGIRSPIKDIMAVRAAALVDRARIMAEVANEAFQAGERIDAGFDLAEHLGGRSARLRRFIRETGNDPEMYQLHAYLFGAASGSIVNVVEGGDER